MRLITREYDIIILSTLFPILLYTIECELRNQCLDIVSGPNRTLHEVTGDEVIVQTFARRVYMCVCKRGGGHKNA